MGIEAHQLRCESIVLLIGASLEADPLSGQSKEADVLPLLALAAALPCGRSTYLGDELIPEQGQGTRDLVLPSSIEGSQSMEDRMLRLRSRGRSGGLMTHG